MVMVMSVFVRWWWWLVVIVAVVVGVMVVLELRATDMPDWRKRSLLGVDAWLDTKRNSCNSYKFWRYL